MYNTIKIINLECIADELHEIHKKTYKELDDMFEKIAQTNEFKELFFYNKKCDSEYYYHSKNEIKIKELFSKYIDISKLNDEICFLEYGSELIEYCGCDIFEIGKIKIGEKDIYFSLAEDFLRNDIFVDRLVEAGENFIEELEKVKKNVLEYLVDITVTEAKDELRMYGFETFRM